MALGGLILGGSVALCALGIYMMVSALLALWLCVPRVFRDCAELNALVPSIHRIYNMHLIMPMEYCKSIALGSYHTNCSCRCTDIAYSCKEDEERGQARHMTA